jgi:hypothetical protein
VAGWSKLALLALVCLPASAEVYRLSAPQGVERIEWSAAGIGWDVDVAYDPDTCEVYCTYRRTHDALGAMPLLQPVTTVRFYTGPMEPSVVVIDPAGLSSPALDEGPAPLAAGGCMVSKRLAFAPAESRLTVQAEVSHCPIVLRAGRRAVRILTLRI